MQRHRRELRGVAGIRKWTRVASFDFPESCDDRASPCATTTMNGLKQSPVAVSRQPIMDSDFACRNVLSSLAREQLFHETPAHAAIGGDEARRVEGVQHRERHIRARDNDVGALRIEAWDAFAFRAGHRSQA